MDSDATAPRVRDVSLEPADVVLRASVLYVVLLSAVVVPFQLFWGVNPLREAFRVVGGWGVALCVVTPLGIAVHEALHATGWAIGGQGWKPVSFGVAPRKLMVYAHYSAPLPLRVYLVGALLPAVAMGAVPAALALGLGWAPLAGWSALFLGFAAGDLIVVWSLRAVPRAALVRDHPVRAGCTILEWDPARAWSTHGDSDTK